MKINIKPLNNNRTELYQWDTDRQIEITPDDGIAVDEIHYATVMLREALVVLPHVVDGTYVADIPNILLQSANAIHIYVVTHTANGERTIDDTTLGVTRRKKPSDYVYTETEVMRYENLESRIKELEDNQVSDETLNEMVQDYLTKNPIKIDVDKELSEESENPVENKAVAKAIREVNEKIPTDYVTDEELDKKGYLTEHQPLDGYAKKDEIPTELPASDVYEWAKQPTKPSYTAEEVGALPEDTEIPDITNLESRVSELERAGTGGAYIEPEWEKVAEIPMNAETVMYELASTNDYHEFLVFIKRVQVPTCSGNVFFRLASDKEPYAIQNTNLLNSGFGYTNTIAHLSLNGDIIETMHKSSNNIFTGTPNYSLYENGERFKKDAKFVLVMTEEWAQATSDGDTITVYGRRS